MADTIDPTRADDAPLTTSKRQTAAVDAATVRRKLRHEDGTYVRNQIRAVAQRVEVISKTDVRIRGNRTELLRTLTAASGVETAVLGTRGWTGMVPLAGLEPACLAATDFESVASTNFATGAAGRER